MTYILWVGTKVPWFTVVVVQFRFVWGGDDSHQSVCLVGDLHPSNILGHINMGTHEDFRVQPHWVG